MQNQREARNLIKCLRSMALLTVYFHAELEETGPGHSGKARPKNQRRPNDDIIHAHWSERILEFTSQ
jgi:hypothetical protein